MLPNEAIARLDDPFMADAGRCWRMVYAHCRERRRHGRGVGVRPRRPLVATVCVSSAPRRIDRARKFDWRT
jgi:hypothetical protein